ncbi:MAG: hypothetical protein EPO19_09805 [Betaproteobacteria bacterium]|nr:MAG: hypothetical protein EPO19_09805 [Betaproteobacteria bacterium]
MEASAAAADGIAWIFPDLTRLIEPRSATVAGTSKRGGNIRPDILKNPLDHATGAENLEFVALIVEEFRDPDPH